MITIEYWHDTNILGFAYNDEFKNKLQISFDLAPSFDVSTTRETIQDGILEEHNTFVKKKKLYKIEFLAFDYTYDALAFAQDHDNIYLTDKDNNVSKIRIEDINATFQENTSMAIIELTYYIDEDFKLYQS